MQSSLAVSRKVAAIAILSAVALSTDYILLPVANVKLMDSIVFLGSLLYGLEVGVPVAAITWLVYGTLNPLGADPPGLLILLILLECLYAIAGALVSKHIKSSSTRTPNLTFGFAGFLCAFIYDLVTNSYSGLLFYPGSVMWRIVEGNILGIPFSILHEVSDFALFAFVLPVALRTLRILPQRMDKKHDVKFRIEN
jgi:hypothetical protein